TGLQREWNSPLGCKTTVTFEFGTDTGASRDFGPWSFTRTSFESSIPMAQHSSRRTQMIRPVLKTVTRTQGNNAALKNGDIVPDGFSLDFEEVPVPVNAFRRMVRKLKFDVCEMALTTYLSAREHGVRFTALPIFLVRAFHHGAILCARN